MTNYNNLLLGAGFFIDTRRTQATDKSIIANEIFFAFVDHPKSITPLLFVECGQMEITIADDLGHSSTKPINTAGDNVLFNGNSGLVLDNNNPNRSYNIKVKLITSQCSAGNETDYNISYTYTPCDDLAVVTNIGKYFDNNGTSINPITNQNVTAVTHPNGKITIQEIVSGNLPAGHTFDHLNVILEYDLGGAFIQTISTPNDSKVFNHGDGNLSLNAASEHRTYFVTFVLYTNLCSNGKSFSFTIKY